MSNDDRQPLGAVPIIPTPFTANEEVDEQGLRELVEHAVRAGLRAICLPAYGSEFYKLSEQERLRVVAVAVDQAAGRLQVIGQSNHGSARIAIGLARANAAAGADMISLAIPRQFSVTEIDLFQYLSSILSEVDVPFLIQDFNPGGPTVSPEFVARLKQRCPNLRYLKLEEPVMAPKVREILRLTAGEVQVLEGWGGMYLLELTAAGISGLMPGLALADILDCVFQLRLSDRSVEAFDLFESVLPQIVFSLQSMELYMYCEKRLLRARGLLSNEICRKLAYTPDPDSIRFIDELNDRILQTANGLKAFTKLVRREVAPTV